MIPKKSGGTYRRPGTLNVDSLSLSNNETQPRVIDFVVSRQTAYGILLNSKAVATTATFTSGTNTMVVASAAGLTNGMSLVDGSNLLAYPPGTIITNIVGTTVTVSKNALASGAAHPVIFQLGQFRGYRATGNLSGNFVPSSVSGTPPYQCAIALQAQAAAIGGYANGLGVDDDIQQVQYTQAGNVMWLTYGLYKPQKLLNTALDTFKWCDFDTDNTGAALTGLALLNAYPYLNQNTSGITFQPSAVTGAGVTLTASGLINGVGFQPGHVGAIFVIDQGSSGGTNKIGAIQITSITDTTHAVGTVIVNFFTAAAAFATWWESAWSNYRGWPKSCGIFQQRLLMGGTQNQPDTTWCSQTANYLVFSMLGQAIPAGVLPAGTVVPAGATVHTLPPGDGAGANTGAYRVPVDDSPGDGQTTGPTGSNPFRITLSQNSVDQIQWYAPDAQFLVGTQNQEWLIAPQNGQFSCGDYVALVQSKFGSDNVPAKRIGYELIFCMSSSDEVRAYQYNYIDSSFFAEPVQLLFDEYPKAETASPYSVGRRKLRYMLWDVSRDCLWCIDSAGNFYGMTRDRKLSVTAWHTHQMGGYDSTKGNQAIGTVNIKTVDPAYYCPDGSTISAAAIPNAFTQVNDIWMVVKRTISGTVSWQLERMIGKSFTRESAFGFSLALNSGIPGGIPDPYMVDACSSGFDNGSAVNLSAKPSGVSSIAYLNGYSMIGNYFSAANGIFKIASGVVAAGVATLTSSLPADFGTAANFFTVGLPFTPIVRPVTVEAGAQIGTAQGAIHVVTRVLIRLYRAMSAQLGLNSVTEGTSTPEVVVFQKWDAALGKSPEVYTGLKEVNAPSTFSRDESIDIQVIDPLPFELTSVIIEAEEYD